MCEADRSVAGQRASRLQATRAKARAQRKRTRFGLVNPMAVATLPKVLKPATGAEGNEHEHAPDRSGCVGRARVDRRM